MECKGGNRSNRSDVRAGIGRAAAELLASKGARIAISDLDENTANTAVRELTSAGYEAAAFPGDLLDQDLPPKLVDAVLKKFGKINVLVNGAGMPPLRRESKNEY